MKCESTVPDGLSRTFRSEIGKPFDRLPQTRDEGNQVSKHLSQARIPARAYFSDDVLESVFKQMRRPLILHLATHGFFQSNEIGGSSHHMGSTFGALISGKHHIENPLLRSGVVLAGVNATIEGKPPAPGAEDGVLTALDVSTMDLVGTELVVLSACRTGLGDVRRSEGVFGLRRAFVQAGSKTLVMSLWKVPDPETRKLMTAFYGNLLEGMGKAEALRKAQLATIARLRDTGIPHPYFWGGFICQGDFGPIEKGYTKRR
jgi:CHAT domain-containing protein